MIYRASRRLARLARSLMPSPDPGTIIAICHCHHLDLVPELGHVLARLPESATLHLSSSDDAVLRAWSGLKSLPMRPVLHRVENRGRDLRPFFEIARGLAIDPDALVLKIHGKRSDYSSQGTRWRRDLLDGLLPYRGAAGRIAQRFRNDPRLGILGAPRSLIGHPVYWGENRLNIARIMEERFGGAPKEDDLGFFAGSMFWMRGALLSQLLPRIDLDAFEPEPLPRDGSYAHAIERIITMAAWRMGWQAGEISQSGVLDPSHLRDRKIPYI